MFNTNLRFPFPSFFFLNCTRFFLNHTFLVENVFNSFFSWPLSFFFLFFFIAFYVESVFSCFSFINSHLRYPADKIWNLPDDGPTIPFRNCQKNVTIQSYAESQFSKSSNLYFLITSMNYYVMRRRRNAIVVDRKSQRRCRGGGGGEKQHFKLASRAQLRLSHDPCCAPPPPPINRCTCFKKVGKNISIFFLNPLKNYHAIYP